MIKISVLVPIYNSEKYLKQCIESIINQTFKEIEIICINDGSNDNSLKIINEFQKKDSRIKLINKKNSGYGNSLNIGIQKSQGEYISIIESDDFIDKSFLETLYTNKENNDIIKSSFYFYPNFKKYNIKNCNTNINSNPAIITLKPSIWSAIYKKEFLFKNSISFKNSKGASYQDVSFQFKTFFKAQKIKLINKPLYFYRTNNEHSSINSNKKIFSIVKEYNEINIFLKNKKYTQQFYNQKLLAELKSYIWNLKRINNSAKKIFLYITSKKFKKYNTNLFFKDKTITLKDKIKLFLIINKPELITLLIYFHKFV